jgi:hypothetical protein
MGPLLEHPRITCPQACPGPLQSRAGGRVDPALHVFSPISPLLLHCTHSRGRLEPGSGAYHSSKPARGGGALRWVLASSLAAQRCVRRPRPSPRSRSRASMVRASGGTPSSRAILPGHTPSGCGARSPRRSFRAAPVMSGGRARSRHGHSEPQPRARVRVRPRTFAPHATHNPTRASRSTPCPCCLGGRSGPIPCVSRVSCACRGLSRRVAVTEISVHGSTVARRHECGCDSLWVSGIGGSNGGSNDRKASAIVESTGELRGIMERVYMRTAPRGERPPLHRISFRVSGGWIIHNK